MRDYAPRFFLINGVAYPDTDEIASLAGNKVLLRYVNAGHNPPFVIRSDAVEKLRSGLYEDIGHSRVDHDRLERNGAAEVIFGQGKTVTQLTEIMASLDSPSPAVIRILWKIGITSNALLIRRKF